MLIFQPTSGSTSIGGTITGGTAGSVLFVNPANKISQNNTSFFWSDTASQLQIGTSNGFDNNPIIALSISGTQNSYFGTYEKNNSNGTTASTDLIVGADNDGVSLTGHFGDFGIQGSGWTTIANPTFNGMLANDIYLYGSGGNLILGTDAGVAGKVIKFFTGGLTTTNLRGSITDTGFNQNVKTTTYNSVATTGWGIPAIYATGRSTAQVGAVASVATYTVGAADGSFWVSANANVTTFAVGTFNVNCVYTDETNTVNTLKLNFSSVTGTLGIAIAAAGAFEGIPAHIRAKSGTAITITTTGTFTSLTYNVEGSITQIA